MVVSRLRWRSSSVTAAVDECANRPMCRKVSAAEATGPRASAQLGRCASLAVAAAHAWRKRLREGRRSQIHLAYSASRSQVAE